MSAAQILKTVETMPYGDRIRHMVSLGREIHKYSADIAALRTGGVYERLLALYTCYTSYDTNHVIHALNDESRLIRSQALKLLTMVGRDTQVITVLESLPLRGKRALMKLLAKRRSRQAVIDLYVKQCIERQQDETARALLSFASADLVNQHIQQLVQPGHLIAWTQLARQHPTRTIIELQRRTETARSTDDWLVAVANGTIPILMKSRDKAVVPLMESLLRRFQPRLLSPILQRVTNIYPAEMATVALAIAEPLHFQFHTVVDRLSDLSKIIALVERNYLPSPIHWFKKLPPEHRSALYQQFGAGWRDQDGVLPEGVVKYLTAAQRDTEARRHLAIPILQTRVQERMPYAAFLPWYEAQVVVETILRNPEPELRSLAIRVLINSLRYHRAQVSSLLAMLKARKNEQDPVRMSMFSALATLPPALWKANHLGDLGQIIQDALNASDQSFPTGTAIERLVIRLLPFHPAWAAEWLAILIQKRGQISHYQLEDSITETDMQRVGPALLPVLLSWETREREAPLLTLLQSLGRRIKPIREFGDLLERLVTQGTALHSERRPLEKLRQQLSTKPKTAPRWNDRALQILVKQFKERAVRLIPRLIHDDPSWATQPVVYKFLHREMQDLITPFLGQAAYQGRFSTGKTRIVLPFYDGFHRWTPEQQRIFEQSLSQLGSDSERDTPTVMNAIRQLGGLIYIPPTRLLAFMQDKRLPVRDTAIRVLGQWDGPEGVTALLGAMDDDRARVAIYALRHALLQMPPDQALVLLEQVPLSKITVAKEVMRLIGDMDTEAAFQKLLGFAQQELHRDVRVALLRAMWTYLDRDETWPILTSAAASADSALAIMAGRTMAPSRSPEVERRLIRLLIRVMQHPDPEVRISVLHRLSTQVVHDSELALSGPLIERLKSPFKDEVRGAANAFTRYVQQSPHLAGDIINQVLAQRSTLQEIVNTFSTDFWKGNDEILAAGKVILAALSTDAMTIKLRLDIGWAIFSISEFASLIESIANAGKLHAEALIYAVQRISNHGNTGTSEAEAVEQAWRNHSNPALRRLGLAVLIGNAKPPFGWTAERRALLEHYRADPEPLVASAGQFTFPPDEPEVDAAS